jgi:hypothetical protein
LTVPTAGCLAAHNQYNQAGSTPHLPVRQS